MAIPMAMPQFQMPGIQMPKGLGNGQSMGFEETEEIGPDGKAHIISEKSFTPGGKKSGKPLTKAQKQQEKAVQKEMKGMAKDMSHMFQGGMFGGGGGQNVFRNNQKWEKDLVKNAIRSFDNQGREIVPRTGSGPMGLTRGRPSLGRRVRVGRRCRMGGR